MGTSRVAAYIREPTARTIVEHEDAEGVAIEQARAYLEGEGFEELVFQNAEWDDDPQSGKAFYIYFRGRSTRGPSFVQPLGGADCLEFAPEFSSLKRLPEPASRGRRLVSRLLRR